jgi:septum formation protein
MKLILASASPHRAEILRNAGFQFDTFPANVDETRLPNETAENYVRRVAREKARTVAEDTAKDRSPAVVMAADTVVVLGHHILGKPSSVEDARRMLRMLSGRTHQVFTGLDLITTPDRREFSHVEMTNVTFVELPAAEIESYLASGEPLDKAGDYGIQGIGGRYVCRIEGCYFNVIGLPLSRLWSALRTLGWEETSNKDSGKG